MATFDPSKFGATPVTSQPQGSFNPTQYGASPVATSTAVPAPQSMADKIWSVIAAPSKYLTTSMDSAASNGANQINKGVTALENPSGAPGQNPIVAGAEGALDVESGLASVISSPLAGLFKPVSAAMQATGDAVGSIPAVQTFANSKAGQTTARVAGDLANAGNVAGTITGADQAVKALPEAAQGASTVAATVKGAATEVAQTAKNTAVKTPESTDAAVVSSYNKAVKPTVAGKTGPGQMDSYDANIVSGVKSIAANKDALTYETDAGNETGRVPQTRGELADAVAQTKQQIFNQYDALTKEATGHGAQIPLEKAGSALDDVINNQALQLTNPEAVNYAKGIQARLKNPDGTYKTIDPQTAQAAIANWNSSLKAFYRNPSYDSASRAAVDAGVANEVRGALDSAINDATGANYSALKKQYGALSAIEKDVNRAAIAQSKATGAHTTGLGRYVDVFSGGDMVSGLLSLNPALFAKGAAQAGISHFFQWFNSPDRQVGAMFKNAEGYSNQPKRAPAVSQPKNTSQPSK